MNKTINTVFRQEVYSFFAEIFLQEPNVKDWPKQRLALEEFTRNTAEVPEFGDLLPENAEKAVERIRQQFYDCFFVPMSGQYVPPFESVLQNRKPGEKRLPISLNSPEREHVAQCYAAVGFNPWELNIFAPLQEVHLPDHIGFELAFMAMLCTLEISAKEKDQPKTALQWQELGRQFMKEHLVSWVPQFSQAMNEIAPGYYAEAAKAVEQWVKSDWGNLDSVFITPGRGIH